LIDQKVIGDIISVKVECGTYLPDWHPNENYSKSYATILSVIFLFPPV
jgi:hypothetical protein